jgi:hypothetical protein
MKCLIIWRIIWTLFSRWKTIFPLKIYQWNAHWVEATNDIDIVLYNAVSREKKRVLINGRPLLDQDNNVQR